VALLSPALLQLHLATHQRFHGPPFDYVGLGLAAAASWIGVPGPGEPALIAAAVLAARHQLSLGSVLGVAWVGATLGGILGWMIGLKAGRAVLTAPGPLRTARLKAAVRGEQLFGRHPLAGVLLTTSWISGINRVRPAVYQPINAVSAAVWTLGLGLGAYLAGPTVVEVADDLGAVTTIVLVALIGAAVALAVLRWRWGRR